MTSTRFEMPTWNEVYAMLLSQADRIRKDHFKPDVILGVSRGGWVPARIHSDLLENPNLATVRTECYDGAGDAKDAPTLTQPISIPLNELNVLVVDDVADTGRSLKLVREHVVEKGAEEVRVATLYRKPWSAVTPDYSEKETVLWVVFPWDLKETVRKAFENREKTSMAEISARLENAGFPKTLANGFLGEIAGETSC